MLNDEIIQKVRSFIDEREDAWALPEEAARFVHATVLACRARRCVEIGTSYGYSGLWIGAAAGANGGSLVTLEKEQRKADIATGFFREAGLENIITCRVGMAEEILGGLEGPVDWILNDADKENCRRYVEILYPKLPIGGVIVTDNACSNEIVREQFVPWVRQDKRFFSTLVNVGNGLEMSVKTG